jgi:hypothetical protein
MEIIPRDFGGYSPGCGTHNVRVSRLFVAFRERTQDLILLLIPPNPGAIGKFNEIMQTRRQFPRFVPDDRLQHLFNDPIMSQFPGVRKQQSRNDLS